MAASQGTHVVMKKNLAQALMEAGVEHFDAGGMTSGGILGIPGALTVQNQYSAGLAPVSTSDYGGNIGQAYANSQAGYGQAQQIQGQQQSLANQLLAQSQGQGPNPAQAALNQNTGANVAAQAALMAGQRGAGANAGLIARQSALQGAGAQQASIGQAATLQAQQQLAAQNQLMNQQSNIANQNIAEQGVNNNLYGLSSGAQNAQNNTAVTNNNDMQSINAGIAQNNANSVNKQQAGILGGIGNVLSKVPLIGGLFAGGGPVQAPSLANASGDDGAQAIFGNHKSDDDEDELDTSQVSGLLAGGAGDAGGLSEIAPLAMMASEGGSVPDHLHHIGRMYHPMNYVSGGSIPGRAKVQGNSYKNDNQLILTSPGEVVLPRSVTQSSQPAKKAEEFMKHLEGSKKGGGKPEPKYSPQSKSAKKGSVEDRLGRLEKLFAGGRV